MYRRVIRAGLRLGQKRIGACISVGIYPNTRPNTLYDPKFDVDSESVIRFVRATRNHEFRAQTGNFGRRAQIDITGSPDQTDLKFELAMKF